MCSGAGLSRSRRRELVDWDRGSSDAERLWLLLPLGGDANEAGDRLACTCRTILRMFPGLDDRVITVVTPEEVARRAATILVDMPPVPRDEPAVDTRTPSASRL